MMETMGPRQAPSYVVFVSSWQVAKLVTAMDGCAAVGETGSLLPLDCRGDKGAPSAALLILAKKEVSPWTPY